MATMNAPQTVEGHGPVAVINVEKLRNANVIVERVDEERASVNLINAGHVMPVNETQSIAFESVWEEGV
jgi:hypothetical protein